MAELPRLLGAMLAAGFTSENLGVIAQSVLGTSLSAITDKQDPLGQAVALIDFAQRYELVRELARSVLYNGAERPALQNYLLGDLGNDMTSSGDGQQNGSLNYAMLRIESKLDQVLADQARLDRRLSAVEAAVQKPTPAVDKAFVLLLALLLAGMFAYTVIGTRP